MTTMEFELTDVGKRWLQEHHPQGIVWEYDVDKPFRLHAWAAEFIEGRPFFRCSVPRPRACTSLTHLGIPYRIPPDVDGKPTIAKIIKEGINNVNQKE